MLQLARGKTLGASDATGALCCPASLLYLGCANAAAHTKVKDLYI